MKKLFKKNKKIVDLGEHMRSYKIPQPDTIGQSIDKILKTLIRHPKDDRELILKTVSAYIENGMKKNKEIFDSFKNVNLGEAFKSKK